MDYTPEEHDFAEGAHILGAEYKHAQDKARDFLAIWQEEHAEELAKEIMKPLMDSVQEKAWDAFRDYILMDTENNVASHMRDMVERTVRALLGGRKWANVKYIQTPHGDGKKIRAALAKLYGDEIKDARITDLEKEVASLKETIEFLRR